MASPHVGVSYAEDFADGSFDEFLDAIRCEGLDARCEMRPKDGAFAGLEWLLPTAIVVFVTKAYFEEFLKEAGKDHYQLLKRALLKLTERWSGRAAPRVRMYFTKGKAESPIPKYSLTYSVMAQLGAGISVKLLIRTDFTPTECNRAVNAFIEFLESFHAGVLDAASVKGLTQARPIGGILLVAFNPATNALEVVDPSPKRIP